MADANIDETSPLIYHNGRSSKMPDERTKFQRKFSVWLILLSAGFERLSFYSLAGNLVLFLTSSNIHWSSNHSVIVAFLFLGTSYTSSLFFAWLSDRKLGRAKTIILGFILYIIGYMFIILFSDDTNYYHLNKVLCNATNSSEHQSNFFKQQCSPQILSTLILIAIGAGAVQANMAVFGAEQIGEQKTTRQYFDKYYAAVNTGGLIAFAFIAYIQQNISYVIGYTISTGLLIIALIFFLIGYKFYIHIQTDDSILSNFFPVFINAFQIWRQQRQNEQITTIDRRISDTRRLFHDPNEINDSLLLKTNEQSWSFLDYAKISNEGKYPARIVDDIKSVRRIIIVFILLIPYWLIYIQIETTFLIQGVHMRVLPLFNQTNTNTVHYMPIIWLSLGDQLSIIIVIFFLNTFIYKRLKTTERIFSIRSRIILGMILATIAMCMAGIVEIYRQNSCGNDDIPQTIGHTTYNASKMSIFWQFPQYIAVGLSELFASVASLEFAHLAAPHSDQSLIMSLRFCSVGLSSFFGSIYVRVFIAYNEKLIFNNNQCYNRDNPNLFSTYFFALAGLQLIFILIFFICDKKFQLLKISKQRLNTRLFVGANSRATTTS